MPQNIFSTYKTGENRVTASILAVLRSLATHRVERILGALMEKPEFVLVRFQNQPAGGGPGVPDAEISSSCRILVETKRNRNALRRHDQLQRHLDRLKDSHESVKQLLVITPDDTQPDVINQFKKDRLTWASFARLDEAIDDLLEDRSEVIGEREAFLLRELQTMLEAEGLIESDKDVVVVAARRAWPFYKEHHAYVCQPTPNRTFRPVKRIAFYTDNEICPLVPSILKRAGRVEFEHGRHSGILGDFVERMLTSGERKAGEVNQVFLLSPPNDAQTVKLEQPVRNDGRSAFTMGQRYVPLAALKNARTTSELGKKS